MLKNASAFMESGYLPDWLIRIGVRRLWVDRANPPFVTLQTQFANIEHEMCIRDRAHRFYY